LYSVGFEEPFQLIFSGVPSKFPYTVRISTGLNEAENITSWDLESVDEYREKIAKTNDGTLPLEPYQRLSQAVFEAWLKRLCDKSALIDLRFGCKLESIQETNAETSVLVTYNKTNKTRKIVSRFVGACDGASSRIRRGLNIPLDGGPV
jgi:FAD-dependent monooxygenase